MTGEPGDEEIEEFWAQALRLSFDRDVYQIDEGRQLVNVHNPTLCEGRGCVIHHPSAHRMRHWPKDFDVAARHFHRYCQHRVAHPDPDDVVYWASVGRDVSVHVCDGCCEDPRSVLR